MTLPKTLFRVIQSDPALGAVSIKVLIQNLQGNPLIDNSLEDTISIRLLVNTVVSPAWATSAGKVASAASRYRHGTRVVLCRHPRA